MVITRDDNGIRLTKYSEKNLPPNEATLFRTAFATYGYLVRKGETLTGEQWAERIAAKHPSHQYVAQICALIRNVMDGK